MLVTSDDYIYVRETDPTLEQLQRLERYISVMETDHLDWMVRSIDHWITSGERLKTLLQYLENHYDDEG